MKRCPQCNRVETDELLKFCRVDGVPLVEHAASDDESTTRILPTSLTDKAPIVHTDSGHAQVITTGLEPAKQPERETDEASNLNSAASSDSILTRLKHHQKTAIVIAALVIAAVAVFIYFYLPRPNKPAATIDSIAVLPFVNATGDPNTEYLSDGITESIINSLSQLPSLGVIARNSAFHYKGKDADATTVGHELNVRSILTGRVLQRGDNLSISVELVDTSNNHQLWGQQYNRKVADVFAVQEEIAKEISEKLRLTLSGAERQQLAKRPTENLKAFQYYMQGRAYRQRNTREDLLAAIHYSEKALEEDRNYALAYAGLADAYIILGGYGYIAPIEGRRKAEESARKALTLDENLAEAHAALGHNYASFVPCNFSLGDRELRHAIELSPSLALAHHYLGVSLVRQGRLDEGLEEFLRARELDPSHQSSHGMWPFLTTSSESMREHLICCGRPMN
jgi:TolB-like protein